MQKGRMKGLSQRGHRLSNGMFGVKALDSVFVTSRQIEAARIAATRYMKREGQLWIKIFPDKPITKKPLEVRMGRVKELWITMSLLLSQDEYYLRFQVYRLMLLKKLCVWHLKSYL